MDNIRDHVLKAIYGGLDAKMTQRNGVAGVVFLDENGFIPFDDLNYNSEYGYYSMSQFPHIAQDCTNENPETIHYGSDFHEWKPLIWADSGGNLALLGDDWQVADLYAALGKYLFQGEVDAEEISEDDPAWGYMKPIGWAVREYRDFTESLATDKQIANTIRAAASAGRIRGAKQSETGGWFFNPPRFRGWLVKTKNEKRGRPRKEVEGDHDVNCQRESSKTVGRGPTQKCRGKRMMKLDDDRTTLIAISYGKSHKAGRIVFDNSDDSEVVKSNREFQAMIKVFELVCVIPMVSIQVFGVGWGFINVRNEGEYTFYNWSEAEQILIKMEEETYKNAL